MGFDVHELTDATNVVTAGDEDRCVVIEFDDGLDFVSLKVEL